MTNVPIDEKDAPAFVAGGGKMGELIRAADWCGTPLGSPEHWPAALHTAVRIMLDSRYPMFVWWGRDLTKLYNDAYIPCLGKRHPHALGKSARDVWPDVWKVVGPQCELVMSQGQATWNDEVLLVMERNDFTEETYFTFSYSPITDERGRIGGLLGVCTEETAKVLSRRRLKTLRDLSERTISEGRTAEEAVRSAADALGENSNDVPFALIYLLADDGKTAQLAGITRFPKSVITSGLTINDSASDIWGLGRVLTTGKIQMLDDIPTTFGSVAVCTEGPINHAAVLPLARAGAQEFLAGFLVVGISPCLQFDDDYRGFLDLAAGHIATAIANARAHEEERKRAEALAEIDRLKTAFFSNVSHEFRTPLTLMLGPIEELRGSSAGVQHAEQFEQLHRNSQRLLKMVNTLLDFSRIEAGRLEAIYQPTNLARYTGELASVFQSAMDKAGLRFIIDCPPLPEQVYVDSGMWEKIVLNLLSNALKFTFEGEIEIALGWRGDHVELAVRDTGVGIPNNELRKIFQRFFRVRGAVARTHEGTGIGLALVQELARLHGGEAQVQSVEGRGSTFTVTIRTGTAHLPPEQIHKETSPVPISATSFIEEALRWLPSEEDRETRRQGDLESRPAGELESPNLLVSPSPSLPVAASPSLPFAGSRILVVDDNADMRIYLRRLLTPHFDVESVSDGQTALDRIDACVPDLVLTDVMMPRLDGFGFLARLRAEPRTRTLPVIMLSARAGEESRIEGLDAGADDYVIKPFSARELLARIESQLKLARLRREVEEELRQINERLKQRVIELQEARRAALNLADQLAEADRRKDEFLATLAHELRNPLAPIRNAVQLLKRSDLSEENFHWAREITEHQLDHMVRLIDDLLDISRISRGKIDLKKERVALKAIIEQALETSRPHIEESRHTLAIELPEQEIYLEADPVRLAQIVSNLVNNACKYSEPGGSIEITGKVVGGEWRVTSKEKRGDDSNASATLSGSLVLSVKDAGIGIAPDHLPRVFEMFSQVDSALSRSKGGLGIGLALVKGLVELHDGSVAAKSDGLGKGSEFIVRLPIAETVASDERRMTISEEMADPDLITNHLPLATHSVRKRVLVVDDNRLQAQSLATLLDMMGFEARSAFTGASALELVKHFTPDVALIDIGLPDIDGYQLARKLRGVPQLKAMTLIAQTGWGRDQDREAAKQAGFDHHLTKPINHQLLEALLLTGTDRESAVDGTLTVSS